ncbi:hypothetical protein AB0J86_12265 [Micromonospora sp. NPDC049559]|uniref:hypothetical protein n=1 Tax=Micromonospora sp. NPDC049559 TaxID=3155923 RepID=UPI00342228EE
MPTSGDRRLRLIKGTAPGTGGAPTSRSVARRTLTRRVPPPADPVPADDPVAAILERLDEEPVEEPAPAAPAGSGPDAGGETGGAGTGTDVSGGGSGGTGRRVGAPRWGRRKATATGRRPGGPRGGGTGWARLRPSRAQLPTLALVLVLCAALATAGVFGYDWYQARALDRAHQQALAAAKQTTVNFVSISAASVDRDLQRILGGATGEFKEQFGNGQAQVRAAVVENKVDSRGSVLRAGLVSGDRRTAVVLVAIDATVKNTNSPDGRAAHYRIQVDMTNESGKWLVSRLQFVG